MKYIKNTLALLILGFITSGCTTGRMADLKDCGSFSVGIGAGLDVTAKAGCLLHPSIGVIGSRTKRVGYRRREFPLKWDEQQVVWPYSIAYASIQKFYGYDSPIPIALISYDRKEFGPTSWLPIFDGTSAWYAPFSFHEITDLELGATLGFVSVRGGINPLEFIDFLLGFAGLDIGKDDPKKEEKPTIP